MPAVPYIHKSGSVAQCWFCPEKRPHCCGVAKTTRCATSSRYFLMQRHRLRSNFWSGPGQTTAQGLACVRVDSSQEQFCVLSLARGSQTRIHGDMRLCAWEGFGANERLSAVTSRSTICFIIGRPDDPTRGSIVSTLNNVCWIWAKRAARANIGAILYCLAVILLELVQRGDRNVTRLAIVICVLRYGTPCHRQTNVHIAALRRGNGHRLF